MSNFQLDPWRLSGARLLRAIFPQIIDYLHINYIIVYLKFLVVFVELFNFIYFPLLKIYLFNFSFFIGLAEKGSALRIDFAPLKFRPVNLPSNALFAVIHSGKEWFFLFLKN
jgi:hypothetical protein